MFFKRAKDAASDAKAKEPAEDRPASDQGQAAGPVAVAVASPSPVPAADSPSDAGLAASALRRTVDPKSLGFKTTAELEAPQAGLGLESVAEILERALAIRSPDFNVFVALPAGSGQRRALEAQLASRFAAVSAPPEVVYAALPSAEAPVLLEVPAGRARAFVAGFERALGELASTLPAAFAEDFVVARRRAIESANRSERGGALDELKRRAEQQNVAILRTPTGYAVAPVHEGRVVKAEIFKQLPGTMQREVEARVASFEQELAAILAAAPRTDRARIAALRALETEVAELAVADALAAVKREFADVPRALVHLAAVERELAAAAAAAPLDAAKLASLVACARAISLTPPREARAGAPLVAGRVAAVADLTGSIARESDGGWRIAPGLLHRANGGGLVLEARDLLANPPVARVLLDALDARAVPPECEPRFGGIAPEAVALDVRVVLVGDVAERDSLFASHPLAAKLFALGAEVVPTLPATRESEKAVARAFAGILAADRLKPADAAAVAALLDALRRESDAPDRLAFDPRRLAAIAHAASQHASASHRQIIARDDVVQAIANLVSGAKAPASTQLAPPAAGAVRTVVVSPGAPVRVAVAAALVGAGPGVSVRVVGSSGDARDAPLLRALLVSRHGAATPLALDATVVLHADGNAVSAVSYAALLSALAGAPPKAGYALVGEAGAQGDLASVAGINAAIEAWFATSGSQAIVIPEADVGRLMPSEAVIAAVEAGRFAIHAAATLDQAVARLLGLSDAASLGARIAARLATLSGGSGASATQVAPKPAARPELKSAS